MTDKGFESGLGVFTSTRVLDDGLPVLLVVHDDDGDWQFLSGLEQESSEARLVHVDHLVAIDPTLIPLHRLLRGWRAHRSSRDDRWLLERRPPTQTTI